MLAYKFLRSGAVGPFSGVAWPRPRGGAPGDWLDAAPAEASPCRAGVHACRVDDLPKWIGPELWTVELRGDVVAAPHKVVAPSGRLLERVTAWDEDAAAAFAASCARRVRELAARHPGRGADGYADDAEVFCLGDECAADPSRAAAVGTVIAVHAASRVGGSAAVKRERAAQVAWFRERLGLR